MNGIANPKVAFKVYTLRNLHESNFQAIFFTKENQEALSKSSLWEY
jgi:hypothetical protein